MRPNQKFVDMLKPSDILMNAGEIIAIKFVATGPLTEYVSKFEVIATESYVANITYQEIQSDNAGEPLAQYQANIDHNPGYTGLGGLSPGYRSILTSVQGGGSSPALVNGTTYWFYMQATTAFYFSATLPSNSPTYATKHTAKRYKSGVWYSIPDLYMKITY